MVGTASVMVPSYLDEHMWREQWGRTSMMAYVNLQKHIAIRCTQSLFCYVLLFLVFVAFILCIGTLPSRLLKPALLRATDILRKKTHSFACFFAVF